MNVRAQLWLLLGLLLAGCSTYDPAALKQGTEFEALAPFDDEAAGHRILIATVAEDREEGEASDMRGAMRFDGAEFQRELEHALGRIVGAQGEGPTVVVADSSSSPAEQAWRDGFDLILEAKIERWDAVFVETNGWWYPNALFLAWYFWPIGPHWVIADEVYGVDCQVSVDLLSTASETSLPLRDEHRRVTVRSQPEDEDVELQRLDLLRPPVLALDDLDRGLDLFGTWISGLDDDQWEQVGALIEPYARRHAVVRIAARVADAVARFDALSDSDKEQVLAATHGVVVGVSAYANECVAADGDAEAFAAMLTGGETPWAAPKNVHELVNGRATKAAVEGAIDAVATRAATQDRVVFYFAGRGGIAKGGGGLASMRLLPYGDKRGISLEDLAKRIRAIPARRRLVVFDVDFKSGQRGLGRVSPPRNLDALLREAFLDGASSGAVVLAGSLGKDEEVQAYEGQGLLTQYLVRGLRGDADSGADGLSYQDLSDYLSRHVVNLSEVALPKPQRPRVVTLSLRDLIR